MVDKSIIFVLISQFFFPICNSLIIPIYPIICQKKGIPEWVVGLNLGIFPFANIVILPFSYYIIKNFSRKPIMIYIFLIDVRIILYKNFKIFHH